MTNILICSHLNMLLTRHVKMIWDAVRVTELCPSDGAMTTNRTPLGVQGWWAGMPMPADGAT